MDRDGCGLWRLAGSCVSCTQRAKAWVCLWIVFIVWKCESLVQSLWHRSDRGWLNSRYFHHLKFGSWVSSPGSFMVHRGKWDHPEKHAHATFLRGFARWEEHHHLLHRLFWMGGITHGCSVLPPTAIEEAQAVNFTWITFGMQFKFILKIPNNKKPGWPCGYLNSPWRLPLPGRFCDNPSLW